MSRAARIEKRPPAAAPKAAAPASATAPAAANLEQAPAQPAEKLAERLAKKIGVPTPPIRTGPAAWRRTEARRTRGLWEEGQIWLDERRVDFGSTDGERLMAHELVHAAQARKAPGDPEAAEAEAWQLSAAVVAGVEVRPTVGLAAGQAAGEGEIDVELKAANDFLRHSSERVHGFSAEGPGGKANDRAIFNDFRDQTYEVFGRLWDEPVFQELIGAVDESERSSVLARLRDTGSYQELAKLWASTKADEQNPKAATEETQRLRWLQQGAYDYETTRWGWTAARAFAYRVVAADAKLHPPDDVPEVPREEIPGVDPTQRKAPLGPQKAAKDLNLKEALDLAQSALASTTERQPVWRKGSPLSFSQMQAAGEKPFGVGEQGIEALRQSRNAPAGWGTRFWDMGKTLLSGGTTYGYEYGKQYLDTLFVDTLGSMLDHGLERAGLASGHASVLKGKYVVGPLYTIGKAWLSGDKGLDDPAFWWDLGRNKDGWETLSKSEARIADRWSRLWDSGGFWDVVGNGSGLVADVAEWSRDAVDWLAGACGNLSAIFCTMGLLFWILSVATVWFPPLSFAFSVAASAVFAVGELLGLVNTGLSLFSLLVLTPLVMTLRMVSSLLVPDAQYQEEAVLLRSAVDNHAKKTAAYRADKAAAEQRKAWADEHMAKQNGAQPQPGAATTPAPTWGQRFVKHVFASRKEIQQNIREDMHGTRSKIKEEYFTRGGAGWDGVRHAYGGSASGLAGNAGLLVLQRNQIAHDERVLQEMQAKVGTKEYREAMTAKVRAANRDYWALDKKITSLEQRVALQERVSLQLSKREELSLQIQQKKEAIAGLPKLGKEAAAIKTRLAKLEKNYLAAKKNNDPKAEAIGHQINRDKEQLQALEHESYQKSMKKEALQVEIQMLKLERNGLPAARKLEGQAALLKKSPVNEQELHKLRLERSQKQTEIEGLEKQPQQMVSDQEKKVAQQKEALQEAFHHLNGQHLMPILGKDGKIVPARLYALLNASSLNITGGFGSAWKDWLDIRYYQDLYKALFGTEEAPAEARDPDSPAKSSAEAIQAARQRVGLEIRQPQEGDGLDELAKALGGAYFHRQNAAEANAALLAQEERMMTMWGLEQMYSAQVITGALTLTEGVELQKKGMAVLGRTGKGQKDGQERARRIAEAKVKGEKPPEERTAPNDLGEAADYVSDFDTGGGGPSAGGLAEMLMGAHLGSHSILVARSTQQVDRVRQSMTDQRQSTATMDSLNALVAADLLWSQGQMEQARSEKSVAESLRQSAFDRCDTESLSTLDSFAGIQTWSQAVKERHEMPPVLNFLGNWALF